MRDEIKKRIEAVRHGRAPEGYVRTDSGIMPEDWIELLVGDIIEFYSEKSTKNNEYPVLTSSRRGLALQTEYFEDQVTREENAGYNIIPFGYFTFRSRSDDGQFMFNQNTIIDKGIVSCFYPVFRVKEDVAVDKYVLCFLNNYLGRQIVKEIVGTSQLVLSEKKLNSLRIILPPVREQIKIANTLAACDRVIELKQKQVEELQRLKKTCLAKMFPRNGANVPELRFPGFTDSWEQRKLSKLCDKFTDGDWIESKDQSDSGVRLVQTGNVGVAEYLDKPNNKKWISDETFERLHCEEVLPGDILISRLPEPAGRACIMPYLETKMITAVDCTIVRTASNVSNEFLVQYLSSQAYFDAVNACLAGGTRQRISRSNLADFNVPIPTDKTEQEAIGGFFSHIDNLITLHQRELEAEQQKKKALMQLLLTGLVRVNEFETV